MEPTVKLRLGNVLAFLNGSPWAVLPEKLDEIQALLSAHVNGQALPPRADPYAARREATRSTSRGAIAIVPVYGVLVPRAGMMTDYSGATSAMAVGQAVTAAANDPNVGTIVLDMDSPGGNCFGITEAAAAIAEAARTKRVVAVVNHSCASAAYFLASQASEIVASPSALVGNIGIIMMHIDASEAQAKAGVRVQLVTAGKYKHEGHGGQPLDAAALAHMQSIADDYYEQFTSAVAQARGVTPAEVANGFGEARILTAKQALAAGMIDRIGTMDSVLAELGATTVTMRGARADAPAMAAAAMLEQLVEADALSARIDAAVSVLAPTPALTAVEATSVAPPLRLVTATPARSITVTDEEKAAAATAAAAVAVEAERKRQNEIRAYARDHNVEASRLDAWLGSNITSEAVGLAILADERQKAKNAVATGAITVGNPREGNAPWESPAAYLTAVVNATRYPNAAPDVRLLQLRAAQNTSNGADGGWAVPETVSNILLAGTETGGELLKRVTPRPITVGNKYSETVVKEEARTNGSRNGGLQHYWLGEDTDFVASQAKLRQIELGLKKVGVYVPMTEEQLEDGPALASYIDEQVPRELEFGQELAIWEGTGAAMPLGFMNTLAVISVAIEGSQSLANTNQYIWQNAARMYGRMPVGMLPGAAWFINPEMWASILTAVAGSGGSAVPMFTPPGQLAQFPNGAIYGKPVIPVEYASAEGTVGDFVFANFSDYLFATKGGVRKSTSMHVEFLRDKQVMKFVVRCDGQPRTRVPVTPLKGTKTVSPYIALAARS